MSPRLLGILAGSVDRADQEATHARPSVTETGAHTVSSSAWIELLHAELCWALARADVDVLVLKGPSLRLWLYPEGRDSLDVDLLVRPADWAQAVDVLRARGFTASHAGRGPGETSDHSEEFHRVDPGLGGHSVDLHRYFPGIEATPEVAFGVLWRARAPGCVGGVDVWFPDLAARTLLAALHAARDPYSAKATEDLRRAAAQLQPATAAGLIDLAEQLQARGALRAGLETQPSTRDLVEQLGLQGVEVPDEWRLRSEGAGLTALRLSHLQEIPWAQRPATLGRWLFPSPTLIRDRMQLTDASTARLALAYLERLKNGAVGLPKAMRAAFPRSR
jgi:hypothetical protein